MAMPKLNSLVWKRTFAKEFSGKTTPELGSVFIPMPGGFGGVCYGGCRVNVGGKGLITDFSDPSRSQAQWLQIIQDIANAQKRAL